MYWILYTDDDKRLATTSIPDIFLFFIVCLAIHIISSALSALVQLSSLAIKIWLPNQ